MPDSSYGFGSPIVFNSVTLNSFSNFNTFYATKAVKTKEAIAESDEIRRTRILNAVSNCFYKDYTIRDLNESISDYGEPPIGLNTSKLVIDCFDEINAIYPGIEKRTKVCVECNRHFRETHKLFCNEELNETKEYCDTCYNDNASVYRGAWVNFIPPITSMGGYHGVNRKLFLKNVDFTDMNLLGLEIETYIPYYDTEKNEIITEACASRKILAERDGSLHAQYGVEFVFLPIPLSEIVEDSFIHQWSKVLRKKACKGWDAGTGYGMHISINAKSMTDLHCGKFCYFINTNEALCSEIAGRPSSMWQQYKDFKIPRYKNTTQKYLAAARRSKDRIEVRIFRSSLNWERIRRNCEFVHSLIYFTKDASASDLNMSNYLSFMQKDHNKKQYFQMRKYLGLTKQKQEALVD